MPRSPSPASKAGLYAMRPAQGSVSANGVFRISRSFDAIGAMVKTPYNLRLLTESILTSEARAKLPENGFEGSMTRSWEGLRVGILPSSHRHGVARGLTTKPNGALPLWFV
jgi:amidase